MPGIVGASPDAGAAAPARVNLIGEHTDYGGGWALPIAIDLHTVVTLRWRDDGLVRGRSQALGASAAPLGAAPARTWLDYVRGVAGVGAREGMWPARGFDLEIESDVPVGAGLSSSAALEVATAFALMAAAGREPDDERLALARLAQRVEREFVGVPCGPMDQLAAACAVAGHALLLDCARVRYRPVPLPPDLRVLVIDTGARRALRDGTFAARQRDLGTAFEAVRERLDRPVETAAELGASDLTAHDSPLLLHVVTENDRVHSFARALERHDLDTMGACLYASHDSLRSRFAASWPEADRLVTESREIAGVVGARMTGAGWGGCTIHLVESAAADAARRSLLQIFEDTFERPARAWLTRAVDGASVRR